MKGMTPIVRNTASMVSTCSLICSSVKWFMVMASKGHSAAQVPHPAHAAVFTSAGVFFLTSTVMALYGHTSAHFPQDLHLSAIMSLVMGSVVQSSLVPEFDIDRYLVAATAMLSALTSPTGQDRVKG